MGSGARYWLAYLDRARKMNFPLAACGWRFRPCLPEPPWRGGLCRPAPQQRSRKRAGRAGRAPCRPPRDASRRGPALCAWRGQVSLDAKQWGVGGDGSSWRLWGKGAVPGKSQHSQGAWDHSLVSISLLCKTSSDGTRGAHCSLSLLCSGRLHSPGRRSPAHRRVPDPAELRDWQGQDYWGLSAAG